MLELLLYADLNCKDAADMLDRIADHDQLTKQAKIELIETIQEYTPHCPWDAND